MRVTVRFFASLREAIGRECWDVDVADPTVAGVCAALAGALDQCQRDALEAPGVRVAVNQVLAHRSAPLAAGDEVAFLPPVTGG